MVDKKRLLEVIKKTEDGCATYYSILPTFINERNYKTGLEIGVFTGGHAASILFTYQQLKRDLTKYDKLIRTGGIIACHDYRHPNFPELSVAIDEFALLHGAILFEKQFHFVYMEKIW